MSNHEEQISCMMDGELPGKDVNRVLDWMNANTGARETWARYHLARHMLREEQCPAVFPVGFAERVSRSVEAEPHWLLPARQRWFRDVAAVRWAAAASLAVLAVFATQELRFMRGEPGEPVPTMAGNSESNREAQLHAEAEERLRDYLTMHNESIQIAGDDDAVARARMVSYSP